LHQILFQYNLQTSAKYVAARRRGWEASEQSLTHGIACLSEELMKTLGKEEVASVKVIQQWEKPWQDKLKFNCDGTFHQLTGDGGWGFIIRDHDGDMVSFAEKDKIMRVIDAFQAKAVACRHGVN
jgi:hypothetical protein